MTHFIGKVLGSALILMVAAPLLGALAAEAVLVFRALVG